MRRSSERRPWLARSPQAEYWVAGLVAIVVIAGAAVVASDIAGERRAIAEVERLSSVVAAQIVAPYVTPELIEGDPAALRRLDDVLAGTDFETAAVRFKLWTPDGRVVYSDEPRLVGQSFDFESHLVEAFTRGAAVASVTELDNEENVLDPSRGRLLEVYQRIEGPSGPLVFESYWDYGLVTEAQRGILRSFAPILVAAIALLGLVQLALGTRLGHKLDAAAEERRRLLADAIDASSRERRHIAADLHDGVVQDLVGVGLSLAQSAREARRRGDAAMSRRLDEAADGVRHAIQGLRDALREIYPPDLAGPDLAAALEEVAGELRSTGVAVSLRVDTSRPLQPQQAAFVYRTVREALNNVGKHAAASSVDVVVRSEDETVIVEVRDDGIGFDVASRMAATRDEGHLGLRIIEDVARGLGGSFAVESEPGGGTSVRLEVPA